MRIYAPVSVLLLMQCGFVSVASKRRFWNPRKWFKRKNKVTEDVVVIETTEIKDALRSRSASELSVSEEGRRR